MQIFLLNDNGRQGYLAVLDSVSKDGRRNAVKYIGAKYGVGYPMIGSLQGLKVKTVRASTDFDKYIKMANPGLMVNPVRKGNVVFDLPFIHFPNGGVVQWTPYFEETVTEGSFSVISGGAIICYNYQQPIFISPLNMKRHSAAFNGERLLINVNTQYTTREITKADPGVFCEGAYHVENGRWVCDKMVKTPIAGYKSR